MEIIWMLLLAWLTASFVAELEKKDKEIAIEKAYSGEMLVKNLTLEDRIKELEAELIELDYPMLLKNKDTAHGKAIDRIAQLEQAIDKAVVEIDFMHDVEKADSKCPACRAIDILTQAREGKWF